MRSAPCSVLEALLVLECERIATMSNLTRWNPRSRMLTVNDMIDQMFDNAFPMPRDGGWANPKVDVVENDNDIVVKAEMPGFNPENIDVRIEGNMLSLRGDYNQENEK